MGRLLSTRITFGSERIILSKDPRETARRESVGGSADGLDNADVIWVRKLFYCYGGLESLSTMVGPLNCVR